MPEPAPREAAPTDNDTGMKRRHGATGEQER